MKRVRDKAAPTQTFPRRPVSGLLALLTALGLVAGAATPLALQADGRGYQRPSTLTLDEAVSRVRRETRARILSADTQRVEGHEEHRVRVLTDQGQVRGYRFDAGDNRSPSGGRYREPSRGQRDRRNR